MIRTNTTSDQHTFRCPACSKAYRIATELIPVQGARVRCKQCRQAFAVARPDDRPPTVWVLTGDPAIAHPDVQRCLSVLGYQCSLERLDGTERATRLHAMLQGQAEPPSVVVFGDMHVLLQDELLELVARQGQAQRVRISTHANAELTEAAEAFCGFDRQCHLPLERWEVSQTIQQILTPTSAPSA